MDKNIIKKHLTQKFVNEAKGESATPGITVTDAAKKKSAEQNKKAVKDMDKDLAGYEKSLEKGMEITKVPNKFNYSNDKEVEYHNQMEIMNGQEMIQYDRDPIQEFKDRAKEAIEGSSRMGNNPEWANVIPAQQGFTGPEFGKNLVKNAEASFKKRMEAEKGIMSFGDDIETVPKGSKPMARFSALAENNDNNKPQIKETMKRLRFKNEFKGVGNALKMIPESYKVDNKVFEMTDGVENYKIRWEGSLTEGKAVVLMASDKNLVNEDMQKMKHLMGYKSQETLGNVKGKARLDENAKFTDIWKKTRTLMEMEDIEDADAKEGDADDAVKHAPEAKKHVEGSVSTEKGTKAPKPKTGEFEKIKKHAPEATKHVHMKESVEEKDMPEAPSHEETDKNQVYEGDNIEGTKAASGEWEKIKVPHAAEAKKHIHMGKETKAKLETEGKEEEELAEGIVLGGIKFEPINESWGLDEYGDEHSVSTKDAVNLMDLDEYGDEHEVSTADAVKKMGLDEYGDEHEVSTADAVKKMGLDEYGMMNEMLGVSNLIDKAKQIAGSILPTLSDEEKQEVMAVGDQIKSKLGDPKAIINQLSGVKNLSPEDESALTQQAQSVDEGFMGDAMKRWASRFSALIAAPVTLVSSIIGMAATGYNTWGGNALLTKVHDAVDGAVGSAGGPLSVLLFFLAFAFLVIGVSGWNAGKTR